MEYRKETRETYDKYAKAFENNTKDLLNEYLLPDARQFVRFIHGRNVLDIGSGPGRDSLFFKQNGLRPLCIDNSIEMIKLCEEKGLQAREMDMWDMKLHLNRVFNGVWANTSLLHVPKKNIHFIISDISEILKSDGIF